MDRGFWSLALRDRQSSIKQLIRDKSPDASYFSNDANSLDKGKDTSERSMLDGFLGCDGDVSLFPRIVALLN